MKTGKKLVKKGVDKHKLHQFNKPHPVQQFKNIQQDNLQIYQSVNPLKESNSIETSNQLKQLPQSSATHQFKRLLKQSQSIRKVKSDDKFSNYKTLITNYEQQHQQSAHKLHQQTIKDLIHKKYQQIPSTQHFSTSYQHHSIMNNIDSKHEHASSLHQNITKNIRDQSNSSFKDLTKKQKQIEAKYVELQQKYKQILTTTKTQTLKYQENKQKLLALKTQHFKDQNLLQSLRNHYFSLKPQKNHKDMITNTQNNHLMVQSSVQTQIAHQSNKVLTQFVDSYLPLQSRQSSRHNGQKFIEQKQKSEDQSMSRLKKQLIEQQYNQNPLTKIMKTDKKEYKKYRTQHNWFKGQNLQQIQQVHKHNHDNYSHTSQNKKHSIYSQKYLNSKITKNEKLNNLQDQHERYKSTNSIKKNNNSFLSSSSLKKNYQNLKNLTLPSQIKQKSIKEAKTYKQRQNQNQNTYLNAKESQKQTPKLKKCSFDNEANTPQKYENVSVLIPNSTIKQSSINFIEQSKRPTKRNATDAKHLITQLEQKNLKGSRLSQKSIKSVKRDLFGAKNNDKSQTKDYKQKSNFLNQFRKELKRQINSKQMNSKKSEYLISNKKNEQFVSEDQYKETFGTREKLDFKEEKVTTAYLRKSRKKASQTQPIEPIEYLKKVQATDLQYQKSSQLKGKYVKKVNIQKQQKEEISIKDKHRGQQHKSGNVDPQTPIYKFYQSRKPISPSSGLSKYRFKPSIKIP